MASAGVLPQLVTPVPQVRGLASGAAATCNWLTNAAVSQTFLRLTLELGGDGTFWLYAAIAAAGVAWVYCALPETNGAPIAAIEILSGLRRGNSRQPIGRGHSVTLPTLLTPLIT